jgi:hypothetical protein
MSITAIAPRASRLRHRRWAARFWTSTLGGSRAHTQALGALPVAAIAAALTWYTVSHSGRSIFLGVAAVIVVGGSIWFATTSQPALALALLMVYLGALDGYLKLSTGSNLVTFVRDILLWALVAGELIRASVHRKRLSAPPLGAWVAWFAVLVLIQLANPQDGSFKHSMAGVRQHLEFVPLFFLAYMYVRTTRALRMFVILLTLLAVANGVVNLIQFHESPAQLASWGPGYSQRVLGGGQFQYAGRAFFDTTGVTHTRPFGLMSDAGAGGLVDAFALGAIVALGVLGFRRRQRYLVLAVTAAVACAAGLVTSQGRASVICGLVVLLSYAAISATARGRLTTLLGVGAVVLVGYFAASGALGGAVTRYQGLNTTQILQTTNRARGYSIGAIPKNLVAHPLGAGLGVGGPAEGQSGAPVLAGVADAETEFSFLTLEAGFPGMVALVGFTVILLALAVRRVRDESDREARILLAAIIAPIGGILTLYAVSAITPTTPAGPYLWTVGGIVSYWLVTRPCELRRAGWSPELRRSSMEAAS